MFNIDPFMKVGISAFFIPTALGCLAYMLATFLAWLFFTKPRRIYLGRLIFLLVLVPIVMICTMPHRAFSGPFERWLPIWVKLEGVKYGQLTVPMWLIIALFKRPKADTTKPPGKIPGANAGGPRWLAIGIPWVARIAQFRR
jgi:hypothetical protein